ncbi:MAG: hypothetical protein HIU85_14090 [Proteobacteria bacterium]|nr:hypothetical protein [Pseudomonadota bacterium]
MRASWLQDGSLAYWGELGTWGLLMLSRARDRQPHTRSLLISRRLFAALAPTSAVLEGGPAGAQTPNGLTDPERAPYVYLRQLEGGAPGAGEGSPRAGDDRIHGMVDGRMKREAQLHACRVMRGREVARGCPVFRDLNRMVRGNPAVVVLTSRCRAAQTWLRLPP